MRQTLATFSRSARGGIELRVELERDAEGLRGQVRLAVVVRTLRGWDVERSISIGLHELERLERALATARATVAQQRLEL